MARISSAANLTTIAEKSGWKKTGRYDEVVSLCRAFAKAFPARVKCQTFGETPEGHPMLALVVSDDGTFDPKKTRTKKRPVVLFQGCIHAGESDGKDAGFLYLKELLSSNASARVLTNATLVFVPVLNIDGHERTGAFNRPNQVGPEEMGWRTTGQNLNLNRDYVKADAPEMTAMLKLLNQWDPILYVDYHVTDGADFEHDIAVMVQPSLAGSKPLREAGAALADVTMKRLTEMNHLPLWFYPSFVKEDEPSSGFEAGVSPPRFSHAYWELHNRLGILVETHSWKDYANRIRSTHDTMQILLEATAEHGKDWLKRAKEAEEAAKALGGKELTLLWGNTEKSRTFEFRGVKYRRERSDLSGQDWIVYDPKSPEIWKLPLFDELKPDFSVRAPKEGYFVPAAHAKWVGEKLRAHGVVFERLPKDAEIAGQTFRATSSEYGKGSFEGRTALKVKGEWKPETRKVKKGGLFVPISQPLSVLVLHMFEPMAPDSFLAWGFFNAHFERKEYMEDYVAEAVGREMMKDSKIRAEFAKRIAEDKELAKDPKARLEFFHRKHPSFDETYQLYPVYRR